MKFYIGQQVEHIRFHYRGVIYDVDQEFIGSEEWYERMAVSKPPKDQPWYHVLVHEQITPLMSQNAMRPYEGKDYIDHPLLQFL